MSSQSSAATTSIPEGGLAERSAVVALTGRLLLSAIFMISGWGKVAAPAATIGYIGSVGLPFPQLGLGIAIAIEFACGVALILGYRARLAAAILAAFSVFTAFAFHFNLSDQNQFIHFLKNMAMGGGLLQVVAFGAGKLSLDAGRR